MNTLAIREHVFPQITTIREGSFAKELSTSKVVFARKQNSKIDSFRNEKLNVVYFFFVFILFNSTDIF